MKNYKYLPMNCPICDEFYFSPLKEEDISNTNGDIELQCSVCGWKYNLDQLNDNDLIAQLKKDFLNKKMLNPKYEFCMENSPKAMPHKCPVCGKYTFPDLDSHEICPICFWEDDEYGEDNPDSDGGANDVSLNEKRKLFSSNNK